MNSRRAVIIVASDRAASGVYVDESGPVARDWLTARGWQAAVEVTHDGDPVRDLLSTLIHLPDPPDLILTSGGTGIGPRDLTPEATRAVIDRDIPGIAEAMRWAALQANPPVPTAALSRAVAGVADRTLIINLPGSPAAVRTSLDAIDDVIAHAVAQLHGGDHGQVVAGASGELRGGGAGAVVHSCGGHRHVAPSDGLRGAGQATVLLAEVTAAPLEQPPFDVPSLTALVADRACGAVATFTGLIRDHDGNRAVEALAYEAHPDAARILADLASWVASEVAACHNDHLRVSVVHRAAIPADGGGSVDGADVTLAVGQVAVNIVVAASHRGAALACVSALIDALKVHVPIWKNQHYPNAPAEWLGA
ncbi:MAG: molybdenum cofactor biosynthesis protein MoaE [Cellulomonadaceae bacterium]|jgi:molybdenum cofactor synthesis domain-containing protein|nr:molybdenum cofactor biosynthesis protein MoaE [Cellulomonadaceae bacterium]